MEIHVGNRAIVDLAATRIIVDHAENLVIKEITVDNRIIVGIIEEHNQVIEGDQIIVDHHVILVIEDHLGILVIADLEILIIVDLLGNLVIVDHLGNLVIVDHLGNLVIVDHQGNLVIELGNQAIVDHPRIRVINQEILLIKTEEAQSIKEDQIKIFRRDQGLLVVITNNLLIHTRGRRQVRMQTGSRKHTVFSDIDINRLNLSLSLKKQRQPHHYHSGIVILVENQYLKNQCKDTK